MSQRGSIAVLFVAFVVPAIMLTSFIAADIARYLNTIERGQKIADDAVMAGVRYLPNKTRAKAVAESFVKKGVPEATPEMQVSEDTVALTLHVPISFVLSKYFSKAGSALTTPLYARATDAPLETLLVLDVSSYLAPTGDSTWGQELDWPASTIAAQVRPKGVSLSERRITQQCFNPSITPLKRAAIELYSYLTSFETHEVGVAFFPGNYRGDPSSPGDPLLDVTRPIETEGQRQARGLTSQSAFPLYRGSFIADESCAAISEYDSYRTMYFSPLPNTRRIDKLVRNPGWSYDPQATGTISAADAIWNHAVVEDRNGDFPEALGLVMNSFLTSKRAGASLAQRSIRHAIILAGDVPHAGPARFPSIEVKNALTSVYRKLSSLREGDNPVRVTYLITSHDQERLAALQSESIELIAFLKELEDSLSPPLKISVGVTHTDALYSKAMERVKTIRTSLLGR